MASAPKVSRKPKPSSNGKSETKTAAATPAKERKARGPRKPAVERAYNMVVTLEKKITAIIKNVGRWIPPVDDAVIAAHVQGLQAAIGNVKSATEAVSENIGALYDAGFEAKSAARGGRSPLAVGNAVVLRDNRYEPAVHGANDYEVEAETGKFFKIRSRVDPSLAHHVPRAWIMHAPAAATDEADLEVGD